MREGPLAKLFRQTEEPDAPEAGDVRRDADEVRREAVERPERRELRPPEPREPEPRPRESQQREPEPRERERPREPAWEPREERQSPARSRYEGIPTPEERLRSVFSADIPENMLDRSPAPPAPTYEREPVHQPVSPVSHDPVLRVVGVGGAGVNAVNRMIEAGIEGVEFIAVNTDVQSLDGSSASTRVHIGEVSSRGLGAGADPELGRKAALEQYDELKGMLKGADMI
ncbi:MAG: hypothetical protein ACR2LH_08095, partial [Thermoleophilaceae bacterium]